MAGFGEVYRNGFQAASVGKILERTRVTKGAFFHHFPSKTAMGYAIVEEIVGPMISAQWVTPLADETDPLPAIGAIFAGGIRHLAKEPVNLGCPLNNLAQEMSPLDEGFRVRTEAVFQTWRTALDRALKRGKKAGTVARDVNTRDAAHFVIAVVEGTLSMAKNSQDARTLRAGLRSLERYLDTLAPE